MTRSQLLRAAANKLGVTVQPYHLAYAIKRGYVEPSDRRPDGWNVYDANSVAELVRYMKERSRPNHPAAV